jgi:hypothetical protein
VYTGKQTCNGLEYDRYATGSNAFLIADLPSSQVVHDQLSIFKDCLTGLDAVVHVIPFSREATSGLGGP